MRFFIFVLLLSVFAWAKPTYRIAVVLDADTKEYHAFETGLKKEIKKLLSRDFRVVFPKKLRYDGKWNYAKIKRYINKALKDKRSDLVITIGILSSHYIATRRSFNKPVIATSVLNPVMEGIPYNSKRGISNKHNLNYISAYSTIDDDIATIKEVIAPEKITVLIDGKLLKNDIRIGKQLQRRLKKEFKKVVIMGVGNNVEQILKAIPKDTDLLYITPMFEMSQQQKKALYEGFIDLKKSSFAATGYIDVLLGALLANNGTTDMKRLIRQIALNVQQIALGFEAGLQEVNFVSNQSLYINMRTASLIGFKPSWELISRATVVESSDAGLDRISLENIMDKAVLSNLDVKVSKESLKQSEAELKKAKGLYLPQLSVGFEAMQVDQDRATASLGILNETRADAYILFSQQLFNQKVISRVSVNKHYFKSQNYAQDFAKLQVALQAAQQYINILKLENTLIIQKKNLELTKQNLKAAKVRKAIGVGNVKDIYRWESKLANDKKVLLQTLVSIKQAKNTLLNILNMPYSTDIKISDIDLEDPVFLTHYKEMQDYFLKQEQFEKLRDYFVYLSLSHMPSISQYKEILKAKKELLKMDKKALYLPDVSVEGMVRQHFVESSNSVRDDDPNLADYPYADNTDWNIGFYIRFPLYQGGAKLAQIEASKAQYLQTRAKEKKLINDIQNNLLNALYQSRALYLSIKLATEALDNSQKNLAVATDIYNQGNSSIIYLLDAQSDTLRAALALNDVKYDFLKYLLTVQYYIGQVNFDLDENEWQEWYEKLKNFETDAELAKIAIGSSNLSNSTKQKENE